MAGLTLQTKMDTITPDVEAMRRRAEDDHVGQIIALANEASIKMNIYSEGREKVGDRRTWTGLLIPSGPEKGQRTYDVTKARRPRKDRVGLGIRIGWWVGDLFRAAAVIKEWVLRDSVWVVTVGNNLIYAATFHYGDPSRNIVGRPTHVVPEAELEITFGKALDYIVHGKRW